MMRRASILGSVLLGLFVGPGEIGPGHGAGPLSSPASEVQLLIDQLASEDFPTRQAAMIKLEALEEKAVPALVEAIASSADPDVRLRAAVVHRAIHAKTWGLVKAFGTGASLTSPPPYGGYWLNRVRFSRDEKTAVVGGGALILYDIARGAEEKRVLEVVGARPGVAVSADGKFAFTGHANTTFVHLVELPSLKIVHTLNNGHTVNCVALSPDGRLAVAVSAVGDSVKFWKTLTGKITDSLTEYRGIPRVLTFSADGKRILLGTNSDGQQDCVFLYDTASRKVLQRFRGHRGIMTSVSFLPEERIATSGDDGTMRVWDVKTGKETLQLKHGAAIHEATVSQDGRRALSAGEDRLVKVWNLTNGKQEETFDGHMGRVLSVTLSADGRRAMSCDSVCCVRLWKLGR